MMLLLACSPFGLAGCNSDTPDPVSEKPVVEGLCEDPSVQETVNEKEDEFALNYDASASIKIKDREDALLRRADLTKYIFGGPLPGSTAFVEKVVIEQLPSDLIQFGGYDIYKMTVELPHKFDSLVYIIVPSQPNGHAVILHQGHGGPYSLTMDEKGNDIGYLLSKGNIVALFKMPLFGEGSIPEHIIIDGRKVNRAHFTHDLLAHLDFEKGSFLRLFIEPVIVGINTLQKRFGAKDIYMIGLSGGGLTTTIAAAIDPRITISVPVAGTYPLALRIVSPDLKINYGCTENVDLGMLRIAGYLDMYILASLEENRKQVQVINKYDSCCFGGEYWRLYEPAVTEHLSIMRGGSFQVVCDDSHKGHKVSEKAYSDIYDLFGL